MDEKKQTRTDTQLLTGNPRRNEMKKLFAAVALSLLCVHAFADPCMDADVSPLGYYDTRTADEIHLDDHGC